MFSKAQEYTRNAREALDMLGAETPPELRGALLHMTQTWLRLAVAAFEHARAEAEPDPPASGRGEALSSASAAPLT